MNIIYPKTLKLYVEGLDGEEIIGIAEEYFGEGNQIKNEYKKDKNQFMNKKILEEIDEEYALESTKKCYLK